LIIIIFLPEEVRAPLNYFLFSYLTVRHNLTYSQFAGTIKYNTSRYTIVTSAMMDDHGDDISDLEPWSIAS